MRGGDSARSDFAHSVSFVFFVSVARASVEESALQSRNTVAPDSGIPDDLRVGHECALPRRGVQYAHRQIRRLYEPAKYPIALRRRELVASLDHRGRYLGTVVVGRGG